MLSGESENILRRFLIAVGDGERAIEAARQRLCLIEGYVPSLAFESIGKGSPFVGTHEIMAYLKNSGKEDPNEEDVLRLV